MKMVAIAMLFSLAKITEFPFESGERLVYEVSYFGITAGYITLEYNGVKNLDNRDVHEFRGVAETSDFFSTLYRVKDEIYLYMDKKTFEPLKVVLKLREGRKKRNEKIIYDHEKGICSYHKNNKVIETQIPPGTQDSFASLYYFRTLSLDNGNVSFNVYGSKKIWTLVASVIGHEELQTPVGVFKSLIIRPQTRFEGVLQEKGDVYMWFSDDPKRIPLKFEAKIKLGTLQGIIVEYRLSNNDKTKK